MKRYWFLCSIICIIVGIIFLYLSSCAPRGLGGGLSLSAITVNQSPLFAVSTFKMTGNQQQPLEISFGYYNNTFDPFKFINLNIVSDFKLVTFSSSSNFNNQSNGKRVIIFGTGWKYGNFDATTKDIFWVGKIIDNPLQVMGINNGSFKTIKGRNFVARVTTPGNFDSTFDNLKLKRSNNTDYTLSDFDSIDEDFRAINFVPADSSGNNYIGAMVGRNVTFYSTSNNLNLTSWQNALNDNNINDPNRPSNFIAFDVIPYGNLTSPAVCIIGSNIGETMGEARFFYSLNNGWSINIASALWSRFNTLPPPFYSVDYVSDSIDQTRVDTAAVAGKNANVFYKDTDKDGNLDLPGQGDSWIFYINNYITFYGITIIKDVNNNKFISVGYNDNIQKAVIYTGIIQDNDGDNVLDSAVGGNPNPREIDLSYLGLNLKETVFFDVTSTGQNIFVVGVDTSNCKIKPYPSGVLPRLTKSLIFSSNTSDGDIMDLFQNMRGIILYSNDGGNKFDVFSQILK